MNARDLPFSRHETSVNERDDDLMRRFLAGQVTEAEREAIENRFMRDGPFFESLESLDHEMMVDLVQGRLSQRWASPFAEAVMQAPDRRRRLDEVRTMLGAMNERHPPAGAWLSAGNWVALAASVIILAGSVTLWQRRTPPTLPPAHVSLDTRLPQAIVLNARLHPGPTRSVSAPINQVNIAPDVSRVRLVAVLDIRESIAVEGRMRAVDGRDLGLPPVTLSRVTSEGLEVVWDLPASALPPGDYLVAYRRANAGSEGILGTRFVRITK